MSEKIEVVLTLEHRGDTHVSFANLLDEHNAGVSVVLGHATWLTLGGPRELAVSVRERIPPVVIELPPSQI